MKASIIAGAVATAFALSTTATLAQVSDKPFQENWAPTKWGKDDSAGSSNHTKSAANVKRAISMIKQNKSVTLGKYYTGISHVGTRHWNFVLTGTPNGGPFGENAMVYHDEMISTEIGRSAPVRRSRSHRREHLEGNVPLQRSHVSGVLRARPRRACGRMGPNGSNTWASKVSYAVASCWTQPVTEV